MIVRVSAKYPDRKNKKDDYYLIGDEPVDVNSKEHKIWENIRNNPAVTLIPSEQSDIVADKIEDTQAKKFL